MSSDIIIIDDKPASAQAANLFEMGRANGKNKGARATLESDCASNRIAQNHSLGTVWTGRDDIHTGTPVSSSIRWMVQGCLRRKRPLRSFTPKVVSDQPGLWFRRWARYLPSYRQPAEWWSLRGHPAYGSQRRFSLLSGRRGRPV